MGIEQKVQILMIIPYYRGSIYILCEAALTSIASVRRLTSEVLLNIIKFFGTNESDTSYSLTKSDISAPLAYETTSTHPPLISPTAAQLRPLLARSLGPQGASDP